MDEEAEMSGYRTVLMVAAVTALAAAGAPHAVAAPNEVPGSVVLQGVPGSLRTQAVDIDNYGVVLGTSDGTPVRWDPFSTATSQAVGIDNAGTILGVRDDQTVSWSRLGLGSVTVLPPPPNFTSYRPVELNDSGVLLGQGSTNEMMVDHPIRWDSHGRATVLGGGYNFHTWASAMNSSGTVAGTSDDGWHMPNVPRYSVAVLWDRAGTVSYLGGPVGGWNTATGINDSGVVCVDNDGTDMHAVLWNWR